MMSDINPTLSGVIVADKPEGMSSFRVVSMVRKITGVKKVGHSGTLDPFATGVLPICVGKSTRVIRYLENDNKEYLCTIRFGAFSDTQDSEGTLYGGRRPTGEELLLMQEDNYASLRRLFDELAGPLVQTPPAYSAVKVNGRKAYEYARKGISVELKPRTVHIYECRVTDFRSEPELEADFLIGCSKGTYIRTICEDIGKKSGFGAYAIRLRRTRSGAFDETDAHTLEEIEQAHKDDCLGSLFLPEEICVRHLRMFELTDEEADHIRNGRLLPFAPFAGRVDFPEGLGDSDPQENTSVPEKPAPRYRAMRNSKLIAIVYPELLEGNVILKIERMLDEH